MGVKFYFALMCISGIFIVSTLTNYNNMNKIERLERLERKFERIFKVSFIITIVFAWVYFGMHLVKYVIWG